MSIVRRSIKRCDGIAAFPHRTGDGRVAGIAVAMIVTHGAPFPVPLKFAARTKCEQERPGTTHRFSTRPNGALPDRT